jgi:hypothetical protein
MAFTRHQYLKSSSAQRLLEDMKIKSLVLAMSGIREGIGKIVVILECCFSLAVIFNIRLQWRATTHPIYKRIFQPIYTETRRWQALSKSRIVSQEMEITQRQ